MPRCFPQARWRCMKWGRLIVLIVSQVQRSYSDLYREANLGLAKPHLSWGSTAELVSSCHSWSLPIWTACLSAIMWRGWGWNKRVCRLVTPPPHPHSHPHPNTLSHTTLWSLPRWHSCPLSLVVCSSVISAESIAALCQSSTDLFSQRQSRSRTLSSNICTFLVVDKGIWCCHGYWYIP